MRGQVSCVPDKVPCLSRYNDAKIWRCPKASVDLQTSEKSDTHWVHETKKYMGTEQNSTSSIISTMFWGGAPLYAAEQHDSLSRLEMDLMRHLLSDHDQNTDSSLFFNSSH